MMIVSPIKRFITLYSNVLFISFSFQNLKYLICLKPCAIKNYQMSYFFILIILNRLFVNLCNEFTLLMWKQNVDSFTWLWQLFP